MLTIEQLSPVHAPGIFLQITEVAMGKPEQFDVMTKYRQITTWQTDAERSRRVDVWADPDATAELTSEIETNIAEAPQIVREEWLQMIARVCKGEKYPMKYLSNLREYLEAQEVLFARGLIENERNEAMGDRL